MRHPSEARSGTHFGVVIAEPDADIGSGRHVGRIHECGRRVEIGHRNRRRRIAKSGRGLRQHARRAGEQRRGGHGGRALLVEHLGQHRIHSDRGRGWLRRAWVGCAGACVGSTGAWVGCTGCAGSRREGARPRSAAPRPGSVRSPAWYPSAPKTAATAAGERSKTLKLESVNESVGFRRAVIGQESDLGRTSPLPVAPPVDRCGQPEIVSSENRDALGNHETDVILCTHGEIDRTGGQIA